jgi:MarR family transcriptional regulator, lower aerobic nicotinate degradation pathway regulator
MKPKKIYKQKEAASAPGYNLEEQIGFILRRAHQRATSIFQRHMGKWDVTPLQFAALVKIRDENRVSQNHLGRLTFMDPATVMGVVGRLRTRGLIRVLADANDKRRSMLMLNPSGLELLEQLESAAVKVSTDTLEPFTKEEQKTLLDLLRRFDATDD